MILSSILVLAALIFFSKLKTYGSHSKYYSTKEYSWVSFAMRASERAMLVALIPILPLVLASLWRIYDHPEKAIVGVIVALLAYVCSVFILRKIGE